MIRTLCISPKEKIARRGTVRCAPTFIIFLLICSYLFSAPYTELNAKFSRIVSHVTIRKVAKPTLANLDYAAYVANPVRRDPQSFTPKAPIKKITPKNCSFGGLLSHQCAALQSTPLTPEEIENAMAWEPLAKRLWETFKTDGFATIGSVISAEKWADPSIFMPYQKIVSAYLHGRGADASLWVKIEFEPWVSFLEGMGDADADGYREIYGRLSLDKIDRKVIASVFSWIQSDYMKKELSRDEIVDWANVLASYWYPKFNTDIVDTTGVNLWPNDQTEEEIKKELSGQAPIKPLIVIRGNPFGEMIYNVFVIGENGLKPDQKSIDAVKHPIAAEITRSMDTAASQNFVQNNLRFTREIKENGNYESWTMRFNEMRKGLAEYIRKLPAGQLGFIGKDGWLFFSKGIDYLNGGDLTNQPPDKNPLPRLVEFQKYLATDNLPMLFVVVPDKAEVYFEKLPINAQQDVYSIIHPFGRKFLKDLQAANIEVVDLLPLFLAAKREDAKQSEGLYQKQDTHWTKRALDIAADAIARRIRQYGWYGSMTQVKYSTKDTVVYRQGDIVDKLCEADKTRFPPVPVQAQQIFSPNGKLYKSNDDSAPILLIGDSFTGVFELIDCKGAGVGSHIACKTGIPVEVITSWGGGPLIRDKIARVRQKALSQKRVVIYMMAARDLYNYSQGWLPLITK
jgi:hypothetical protein